MLEVRNLSVAVDGKTILKDITLEIQQGEVMVLFGPNGSGKSTLVKTIMGLGGYTVQSGEIRFKGKKINDLLIEERVRLGMGIFHQHSPKIRGVKLQQVAQLLCGDEQKIEALTERFSLREHLPRELNAGFSGGEMKRSELLQVLLQDPDLLFLDEPESGVDVENISVMGKALDEFFSREGKSALIITHTGYILDYIKAQRGCIMMDGKFWCVGNPREIFASIREGGYEKCKECQWHHEA